MKIMNIRNIMKHLKYFENKDIDPFDEEDWDEVEYVHPFKNSDTNFDGEGNLILVNYGNTKDTIITYLLIQTIYENGDITLYKDIPYRENKNFYPVPESEFKVMKKINYPKINIYNMGKWEEVGYNDLSEDVKKRIVLK